MAPHLRGSRKKHKSFEPQRHEGTKEDFICLPGVAQTSPEKTLCLRVFVVPFFSEPFASASIESVAKSIKAMNHEEHEGHKGKEKLFFVLFAVKGFSAFCNRFLRGQGFGLDQESLFSEPNQLLLVKC